MISPVTADYLRQGIQDAWQAHAQAVILQLDTPGGLLGASHEMEKQILNAPLPVIVYVAPAGARAGSAGVFITMAAHIAAMSPATRIGAAHPVDSNGQWPAESGSNGSSFHTLSQKILNDTVADVRNLAKQRGRNQEWAVRAVLQSESITAEEALQKHVIDILAPDMASLLRQSDGRVVTVQGKPVMLHVAYAQIKTFRLSTAQEALSLMTNPLLAYFLMMIGFYGLLFEITHPGVVAPGVLGAAALILGLIGMQALSINMAGLAFVAVGLMCFIAEIFTPSFGVLLIGGIGCTFLGTWLIYQTNEPYLKQFIPMMLLMAGGLMLIVSWILWRVVKVHHIKAKSPMEKLIEEVGKAETPISREQPGKIRVNGEVWDAVSEETIHPGTFIQVVSIDPVESMLLHVVSVKR